MGSKICPSDTFIGMPNPPWKIDNVFDDILHRGNSLTAALRYFLQYRPIQDAFLATLPDENIRERIVWEDVKEIEMHDSPADSSEGRPDLVVRGRSFVLVVEVKIGAELTKYQKGAYVQLTQVEVEEVRSDNPQATGFVAFLIPDDYGHRDELDRCLEEVEKEVGALPITVLPPLSWSRFIEKLESEDLPSLNPLIREFYDHLDRRFRPPKIQFSDREAEMINSPTTAQGILKLFKLIDQVCKKVIEDPAIKKQKNQAGFYGYTFFSEDAQRTVYFGIWWEFWAEEDGSPLCLAIWESCGDSCLEDFRIMAGSQPRLNFKGSRLVSKISDAPVSDTDCTEWIPEISDRIKRFLKD